MFKILKNAEKNSSLETAAFFSNKTFAKAKTLVRFTLTMDTNQKAHDESVQ